MVHARTRTLVVLVLLLTHALPAIAQKELPEPLQKIHDAKQRGERYLGMTWHGAEEIHLRQLEDARRARAMGARVGGSHAANATDVTSTPFVDQDTTVGKGNDATGGSCLTGGSDTAEDAWYRLTFTEAVELELWTTCESQGIDSYDTRLHLYDENLVLLACNDDAPDCPGPYYQSRISNVALAAGTYYAVVDGYNGAAGNYEFNASWGPGPVICEGSDATNATVIDKLPFVDVSTTTDQCDDILVDCELQTGASGPDAWYRIEFDTAVLLDFRTQCEALDLDSRIAVLDSELNVLHCNDDDPLCATHQSEIEDAFLSPGIYYLVVDSPEGAGGNFTVDVDTTHAGSGDIEDLLPDIVVIEDDLYDNEISTTVEAGRVHLRLSNATANLGDGKLYLYGVQPDEPAPTHDVRQRIWRTDGTWYDRSAGQFVYHPGHNHIHIEGWAQYNLREITAGDGVGPILASGTKTSFCIIDLRVQDDALPNYVPGGEFRSCSSTIQGLSVGWADIYSKGLTDQWIDVTDIADGTYWLESVADPGGVIAETNEANNVARIKVTIGAPAPINPDPYEPNPDMISVDGRPEGQNNSPNLGPCGPSRTIEGLTLHEAGDSDWYVFYMPATGGSDDFVRVDFQHGLGDIDMRLFDMEGNELGSSTSTSNFEEISMNGRAAGWYAVNVFGFNDATHPDYDLTVDPSSNGTPTVNVTGPPAGDVELIQSIDVYDVTWTANDPEGNEIWAKVWVNAIPEFDGNEFFLETSLNRPGALGAYALSTTYLDVGTYYVYVEITDGGTSAGDWSDGTMTLVPQATDAPSRKVTRLMPPKPNPFNPATELTLVLEHHVDHLKWNVYDLRGQLVRTLPAGHMHPGTHVRVWDGRDDSGRPVASGVYYAVVKGGAIDLAQKLVLVK